MSRPGRWLLLAVCAASPVSLAWAWHFPWTLPSSHPAATSSTAPAASASPPAVPAVEVSVARPVAASSALSRPIPAAPILPARPAAPASVEAPMQAPITAASASSAAAQPASDYAPYTDAEWRQLWQEYQPLALCTDHYMRSAGINGQLLGVRLVQLGQAAPLAADAQQLLGAALPALAPADDPKAQAAQAAQTILTLMQTAPEVGLGPALARKATARYYLAKVAGPACPFPQGYRALLTKAWQGQP